MGDYGSSVRDYALAYALMSQYGLKHDRSEVLLSQLTNRLGNRSYLSTQEQMALLLAARAIGGDKNTPWEAALTVNGVRKPLTGGKADATVSLAPADLASTQLTNSGSQSLFVEYDIQGSPTVTPSPRSDVIQPSAAGTVRMAAHGTAARCRPATCWWSGCRHPPTRTSRMRCWWIVCRPASRSRT